MLKFALKASILLSSCVIAPQVMASALSGEDLCVIDVGISPGYDGFYYRDMTRVPQTHKIVGWWKVDTGGGWGRRLIASDGSNQLKWLGRDRLGLSIRKGPVKDGGCITDVQLRSSDWHVDPRAPSDDHELIGMWDVDQGGSLDSGNRTSNDKMALFVSRMGGNAALTDMILAVSDKHPNQDVRNFPGYKRVGWWDIGQEGKGHDWSCGVVNGKNECGNYGAQLFVKYDNLGSGTASSGNLVYTGRWVKIGECAGSGCGELRREVKVGSQHGLDASQSQAVSSSLSVLVGAEAKVGFIAEASAKIEVTGTVGAEWVNAVSSSLSKSKEESISNSCTGQSSMWQWESSVSVDKSGKRENYVIPSSITRCAPYNASPSRINDVSWSP